MSHTLPQLVEQIVADASGGAARAGRAAGRLMSLLENQPERLPELLQAAGERARWPRLLLGVTGAPGSGKSTLTDALIAEHRRRWPDRRVGVVAVDPSSPFTGGAVLGDRVRMMRHATDPQVFVRSLASRGHLGGLSLGVRGIVRVMGLIGCDVVFIETVGVGQSEVEVARVADQVMVVLAPGQGDAVQLLKAGLLEIGDLFVVNKADRPGADQLHAALLSMMRLEAMAAGESGGDADAAAEGGEADEAAARVLMVSATESKGVGELLNAVERAAEADAERDARRELATQAEVRDAILEDVRRRMVSALDDDDVMRRHVRRVLAGEASVRAIVDELLRQAAPGSENTI